MEVSVDVCFISCSEKAKNKETKISVPINVRHVGMNDAFRHGNPASQHSNFTVEVHTLYKILYVHTSES